MMTIHDFYDISCRLSLPPTTLAHHWWLLGPVKAEGLENCVRSTDLDPHGSKHHPSPCSTNIWGPSIGLLDQGFWEVLRTYSLHLQCLDGSIEGESVIPQTSFWKNAQVRAMGRSAKLNVGQGYATETWTPKRSITTWSFRQMFRPITRQCWDYLGKHVSVQSHSCSWACILGRLHVGRLKSLETSRVFWGLRPLEFVQKWCPSAKVGLFGAEKMMLTHWNLGGAAHIHPRPSHPLSKSLQIPSELWCSWAIAAAYA